MESLEAIKDLVSGGQLFSNEALIIMASCFFFQSPFLQVLRKIYSARSKLANILRDCFWLTRRTKLREKDCKTVTYHFDCLTQIHKKNLKHESENNEMDFPVMKG